MKYLKLFEEYNSEKFASALDQWKSIKKDYLDWKKANDIEEDDYYVKQMNEKYKEFYLLIFGLFWDQDFKSIKEILDSETNDGFPTIIQMLDYTNKGAFQFYYGSDFIYRSVIKFLLEYEPAWYDVLKKYISPQSKNFFKEYQRSSDILSVKTS